MSCERLGRLSSSLGRCFRPDDRALLRLHAAQLAGFLRVLGDLLLDLSVLDDVFRACAMT
jgi:hypothetical protein